MRRPTIVVSFALMLAAGCDKKSSDGAITAPPESSAKTSSVTATSTAPAELPTSVASAVATLAASAASATATAAPSAAASVSKSKDAGPNSAALKPVTKHVPGKNFALDVASPGCRAGEDCALTIKLVADGAYHVNKEYPYKFIATPAPGVTYLGKSDPNQFTRAAGDFVEQGEKTGLMTVRFKASSPGEAKVTGKYKLSVCSADQCLIEDPSIDLTVPVL